MITELEGSQLVSLITDRRLEQGARMTNRTLERETTRREEVTPDIIWQMTDGVISTAAI